MTRTSRNPVEAAAASPRPWLIAILVLAIALGVGVRCDGLARRPLWYDEVATTLRLSGATEADVQQLYDGRLLRAGDLLRQFQHGGDEPLIAGVARVTRSVAIDEPQLAPGYFVTAYLWSRAVGDGRAWLRALSALASIGALALLGALAWRLFRDRGVALAATALAAVSPLQIRYAQEARAYALWSVLLLATTLALLRACEHGSRAWWALVALGLAAALYVHPLSLLVVPALLLAATARPDARARRSALLAAGVAVATALLLWLPWALVLLENRDASLRTTSWSTDHLAPASLLRAWLGVATSVFFRPGGPGGLLDGATGAWSSVVWAALGAGAALLGAAALASVTRGAAPAPRRFVPALAVVPFAALALADVLLGGRRSTVDRYLLPAWIALELAVAFLLMSPGPRRRLRHAVLLLVLALGAATLLRTRPLDVWWNTDPTGLAELRAIDARLGRSGDAIVLTDLPPLRALELAQRLDPSSGVRLGRDAPARVPADEWARTVLVQPSPELVARTQQLLPPGHALSPDPGGLPLWHTQRR